MSFDEQRDNRSYEAKESCGEALDGYLSYLLTILRNGEVKCCVSAYNLANRLPIVRRTIVAKL
jgi:hypothetical protein